MSKKKPTIESYLGRGVKYDVLGTCVMTEAENRIVLQIRGWGAIQHLFTDHEEAEKFQDEIGEYVTSAINEKLSKKLSTTKNKTK